MIKEFNNKDEIEKYYDEKTNTYIFKEDDEMIDLVVLYFNLNTNANIKAYDIKAYEIIARDIEALDINANDIIACDIHAFGIKSWDIYAWNVTTWEDINALGIKARDIKARNIYSKNIVANNIEYERVCYAIQNIKCNSIKGRRKNAKHFVLDGTLEVEENDK